MAEQNPSPRRRNFRFEWGNFWQGGLALYLLGIFVLAVAVPAAIPGFPATEWLNMHGRITPGIAYFMIFFGVILLLMATGVTFSGDAGAVLMLFQVRRGEKSRQPMSTVTVSSNRFMANERVKSMSSELQQTLLAMLARGERTAAIEHYRRETKTDPRLAANVIEQLLEFERRGLLAKIE